MTTTVQLASSRVSRFSSTLAQQAQAPGVHWFTPLVGLVGLAAFAGCGSDPQYVDVPEPLVSEIDPMTGEATVATSTVFLPARIESASDARTRVSLATKLATEVPYVRLDDVRISVEWRLVNRSDKPATAKVLLNGGNDRFYYDPGTVPADEDDEAPTPPSLLGNTPINVGPNEAVTGQFRDDQLLEAAIDVELITRCNQNPFRAVLTVNENDKSIQPFTIPDPDDPNSVAMPTGNPIPREALGHLVRLDVSLLANQPMELTYVVRVQDDRGILHEKLTKAPMRELTTFAPALYAPMAPQ